MTKLLRLSFGELDSANETNFWEFQGEELFTQSIHAYTLALGLDNNQKHVFTYDMYRGLYNELLNGLKIVKLLAKEPDDAEIYRLQLDKYAELQKNVKSKPLIYISQTIPVQ